jgi:S-formylglutathione hydrolase FrmB
MIIIMPNAGGPNTRVDWNGYFNMEGWAYEDFFFQELMPTLEKKYRIIGDKANRAVSGLSMGGGGCTVYAQRHPDLFSSCYAMSAWLTSQDTQVNPNDHQTAVSKAVHDLSAIEYVRNASAEVVDKLKTVRWFVDIGDDDFLLDQDLEFHRLMRGKRITCELRVRNGGHVWEYWTSALRTSLPFAAQSFKKE